MLHTLALPRLDLRADADPPAIDLGDDVLLHRKNALFYKTRNGARVGDQFMSLIHTCRLNRANPFDYLTRLQRHAVAVANGPQLWMPWNYRDAPA